LNSMLVDLPADNYCLVHSQQ